MYAAPVDLKRMLFSANIVSLVPTVILPVTVRALRVPTLVMLVCAAVRTEPVKSPVTSPVRLPVIVPLAAIVVNDPA